MNGSLLRMQLFCISYTPLALIFSVRSIPSENLSRPLNWLAPVLFLILTGLGLLLLKNIFHSSRRTSGVERIVRGVSDEGANAAAYLATYLFPFILLNETSWQSWAGYAIYMVVLGIVTIRSDLILVNPTLYILGRQVIRIEFETRRGSAPITMQSSILVCRRTPKIGDHIQVVQLADGYLERSS